MSGPRDRCTRCDGTGYEMVNDDVRTATATCAICEGTGHQKAGELKILLVRLSEARTFEEQATLIRDAVRLAFGRQRAA